MPEKDPDNIKLAVLEEKLGNMVEVLSRLDTTIEKLSDLSVSVSRMLAVHEEKLDFTRESLAENARDIEDLGDKLEGRVEDAITRINTIERKVWMGMGGISLFFVTLMIISPFVTELVFVEERPAIIVPRN
jgi:ABC-type transporter Mla subunit MlaD